MTAQKQKPKRLSTTSQDPLPWLTGREPRKFFSSSPSRLCCESHSFPQRSHSHARRSALDFFFLFFGVRTQSNYVVGTCGQATLRRHVSIRAGEERRFFLGPLANATQPARTPAGMQRDPAVPMQPFTNAATRPESPCIMQDKGGEPPPRCSLSANCGDGQQSELAPKPKQRPFCLSARCGLHSSAIPVGGCLLLVMVDPFACLIELPIFWALTPCNAALVCVISLQ